MRPRSIVALIVAAVFVLAGVIVCAVSSSRANASGIMLFPEADDNENLVYKMDLDTAGKITVNTIDADITVVGGAEKSYIEVINFNANYYKLSKSSGNLVFAQVDDFFSMFKFWENGFSFKGMRYLLRFGDDVNGNKHVIVHLSGSDDIRHVNVSTESGNVILKDCPFAAEYVLKSTNGNVSVTNIMNSTSLSVSGSTFVVTTENVTTQKFTVASDSMITANLNNITAIDATANIADGEFNVNIHDFENLTVNADSAKTTIAGYNSVNGNLNSKAGDIAISFDTNDSLAVSVTTAKGKISDNGSYVEKFSLNSEEALMRADITTTDGDVTITRPASDGTATSKPEIKPEETITTEPVSVA